MSLRLKVMWDTQQGDRGPVRIASSTFPTEEQNKDQKFFPSRIGMRGVPLPKTQDCLVL